MKPDLQSIQPLTDKPFLNLYQADYRLASGKDLSYYIASRRELTTDTIEEVVSNAVTIFAVNQAGDKLLMVKEFRYPINQFAYSVPSGLIDAGEDSKTAALRELREETGYTNVEILTVLPATLSTVGLTDERVTPVIARINEENRLPQALEESELIEFFWVDKEAALEYALTNQNLTARTQLALLLFATNQLTKF